MLARATCLQCQGELPLTPKIGELRFAPYRMLCPHCGHRIETTFPYRVTWMEGVLLQALLVVATPLAVWQALAEGRAWWLRALLLVGAPVLAFLLSRLLALPGQLVVDAARRPRRK